mmetsp:Transcript_13388/g.56211  ORF Transcript_13388/g.56211 Transcript_13388/m.56211 type:complete len:288 (+) Transcript_13388:1806-2669(+)
MMKKSSMKMAPNGNTPPTSTCTKSLMYHACAGTCLGILFVRMGCSIFSVLSAWYAPAYTKGTETPNHRKMSRKNVPNGTAPELLACQMSMFKTQNTTKITPGYNVALTNALSTQLVPLNVRYRDPETYPLTYPAATYSVTIAVISAPRFAGLRKPRSANTSVTANMHATCAPVPTSALSRSKSLGGRNTSPCTNFQPLSSAASSAVSSSLYLVMSRRSVRSMMSATIPDRNSTIIMEFTMENQWICASVMSRYVSQRLAQRMSDGLKSTSYVKITSSPARASCGGWS